MKKHLPLALVLALTSLSSFAGDSAKDLDEKAEKASKVLNSIVVDKEIPASLIKGADCVAAVTIVKGGFAGFGAKSGQGLATCRVDGGWSNPSVINVNGASLGPQIGVGKVSMVMVFVGSKSVEQLKKRNMTGDAQLSLVAGPVGREAMAGVDFKLDNGIYSYSSAKGLYIGATIGAAMISPDKSSNAALYKDIDGSDISTILETPASDDLPASFHSFISDLQSMN